MPPIARKILNKIRSTLLTAGRAVLRPPPDDDLDDGELAHELDALGFKVATWEIAFWTARERADAWRYVNDAAQGHAGALPWPLVAKTARRPR